MGFIAPHKEQILKLCMEHKVKSLYAFGSVNTDRFSKESDIDLLVDIISEDPLEYTDHYFGLKFALEQLFDRPVDLLENKAVQNPFLRDNIDRSKVLIYGH